LQQPKDAIEDFGFAHSVIGVDDVYALGEFVCVGFMAVFLRRIISVKVIKVLEGDRFYD
jgi:hypothetical protein